MSRVSHKLMAPVLFTKRNSSYLPKALSALVFCLAPAFLIFPAVNLFSASAPMVVATGSPTPTSTGGGSSSPSATPTCCMVTSDVSTTCQYHPAGPTYDIGIMAIITDSCGQPVDVPVNFYLEGSSDGVNFTWFRRTSIENHTLQPGQNTVKDSMLDVTIPDEYVYYRIRSQFYNCGIYFDWSPAWNVCRPNVSPSPTPASISGTVTYGNAIGAPTPRFISNVTITGTGSPNVFTTTLKNGGYTLSGFGAGSYTVTPSKTDSVNGITSFDAARIAQHVSGVNLLIGNQLIVADVSGDGTISSIYAAMVSRFTVGTPPFGNSGTWIFIPVNRNYASVTGNVAGEDYVGLLMGE